MDVYLDAVLQPRCVTDPKTFAQEGWHYELDDAKVNFMLLRCNVNALKASNEHLYRHALVNMCQPVAAALQPSTTDH